MISSETGLHAVVTTTGSTTAGLMGGHNINSIMSPPDAHLNSSSPYNNSSAEEKYSLVSSTDESPNCVTMRQVGRMDHLIVPIVGATDHLPWSKHSACYEH